MLRNLNQKFGVARLLAGVYAGTPGSQISQAGTNGPSLMGPSIDPVADAATEFRYWIHATDMPEAALRLNAAGAGAFVGLADGVYLTRATLYGNDVPLGEFTISVAVGAMAQIGGVPRVKVQMAPSVGSLLHSGTPGFIGRGDKTLVL